MWKKRFLTTITAVFGGMVFAYALVQIQHNPDFLLGDIFRLTLPDDFVGVYHGIDNDVFFVWQEWFAVGDEIVFDVLYNPDRIVPQLDDLIVSGEIIDSNYDMGILSFVVRVTDWWDILSFPFVSDGEYHILVSDAFVDDNSVAIQRVSFHY